MLYTLTIILITIISVLMVIVILLQSGQGQGLSGGMMGGGGGMMGGGGNMMGARRTADFLSKATSILAATFLTLCVLANFFIDRETFDQSTIQQQSGFPTQTQDFDAPADTDSPLPEQQDELPDPIPQE